MSNPQYPQDSGQFPLQNDPRQQFGQSQQDVGTGKQKKKGGCLKIIAIIVGVIIALAILSSLLSGGDDSTTEAASNNDSTQETAQPAETPEPHESAVEEIEAPAPPVAPVESEDLVVTEAPQATAEADSDSADTGGVPVEYRSALRKADTYANMMHMSKLGLYEQLTSEYGEQFSPEAAQYAVENIEADWNENALEKAKTYQEDMAMSPSAIYDQLISEYGEQFTTAEADYAIQHLNS